VVSSRDISTSTTFMYCKTTRINFFPNTLFYDHVVMMFLWKNGVNAKSSFLVLPRDEWNIISSGRTRGYSTTTVTRPISTILFSKSNMGVPGRGVHQHDDEDEQLAGDDAPDLSHHHQHQQNGVGDSSTCGHEKQNRVATINVAIRKGAATKKKQKRTRNSMIIKLLLKTSSRTIRKMMLAEDNHSVEKQFGSPTLTSINKILKHHVVLNEMPSLEYSHVVCSISESDIIIMSRRLIFFILTNTSIDLISP
jgi:hypothetical protein